MSIDSKLLNSLVNYVLDVKPYHTKLKEFLSELFFEDKFNATITESLTWDIHHQNVWGRDDLGGYKLQRLCEGIQIDRTFRIPAAIWPRWSLNDRLNYGQTPPGDDPATLDVTDNNSDGIPDSEQPWTGDPSSSHFTASQLGFTRITDVGDIRITDIGDIRVGGQRFDDRTFGVPFHQGSRVYLDGVPQVFGVDYTVDSTRSWIRFAVAPAEDAKIDVQLFKVDRLFIAYNLPFDYNVNRDYDMYGYDMLPYDSSEDNPGGVEADYFTFSIDNTQLSGHQPVQFYNSVPSNLPKAQLTVLGVGAGNFNGDVWKITAIGPWRFKVERQSATGFERITSTGDTRVTSSGDVRIGAGYDVAPEDNVWYVNFKEVFDNGYVSFVIDRVWSDYYIVPDNNSYDAFDIDSFDIFSFDGVLDPTDFLPGLDLVTEHGVVNDPIPPRHKPIEFVLSSIHTEGGYDAGGFDDNLFDEPTPFDQPAIPLGKVKKITQNLIPGALDYYAFVLNETPLRGTYVELRVEQNGQLNPWMNATVTDDMYLQVSWPSGGTIYVLDPYEDAPYDDHEYDTNEITIPPGTTRLIHNVNLNGSSTFTETQLVDELVLYHGQGSHPTNVTVMDGASPVPVSIYWIDGYFEGSQLPANSVGVDRQRVIVSLATPAAVTVTITFT